MPKSLPFDDEPAISRLTRVWLLTVALLAVGGMVTMIYLIKYHDAAPFGALVAVIFAATGVLGGYPGLYPREVERKFVGFAHKAAMVSTILLIISAVIGAACWLLGPYL